MERTRELVAVLGRHRPVFVLPIVRRVLGYVHPFCSNTMLSFSVMGQHRISLALGGGPGIRRGPGAIPEFLIES